MLSSNQFQPENLPDLLVDVTVHFTEYKFEEFLRTITNHFLRALLDTPKVFIQRYILQKIKMQDLLLQQVPVPENQQRSPQEALYNETNNYTSNDVPQNQTGIINGKSSAVVQPMPSTTDSQTDDFNPTKFHSYPGIPYQYNIMPQNVTRPITPPAMTYLVPSYMAGPIVSPFQTNSTSDVTHKKISPSTKSDKSSDEEFIDVVNDSLDNPRNADTSKDTDTSLSTNSTSGSPSTGSSANSSPSSTGTSTPDSSGGTKKKARTNYSPEQVQALEKVFHEQPYPDPEMMEKLSKDLDIPEGKIKVWFQNKRARWRRRAQETANNNAFYPFMTPLSPVVSPVPPYGFMAANPMFPGNSPPAQVVPGHLMYPGTPGSPSNTQQQQQQHQQQQQMTSPYQTRPGQIPPYFYTYPYGMFPPYYRG